MLRRSRGFTAAGIGVVALGIGANTAVFSVVNAVLLEPLPYPESERIIQLVTSSRSVRVAPVVSIPKFNIWREEMRRVVDPIAAYQVSDPGVNLTGGDRPEHLRAMHVSAGYFDVFGAEIRLGRTFSAAEDRVQVGVEAGPDYLDEPRYIVGVVDDLRDDADNLQPQPTVYVPLAQVSDRMTMRVNKLFPLTWLIRTAGSPIGQASAIEAELRSSSGGLPIARTRTMQQIVATSTTRAAFSMPLLVAFATVALALAIVGLYTLISHSVQQRTQEIGIRMALGAVPGDVRGLVLVQGLRLAAVGVVIGVGAALLLTRLMVNFVFAVRVHDLQVFGSVVALLAGVALVAAYIPARRATRVNPQDALRSG